VEGIDESVKQIEDSVEKSEELMDRAVREVDGTKVGVELDVRTIDKKRNY
jgi:hypothetical protein